MKGIVSVAGAMDTFGSSTGIIIDGFVEGPAGRDLGDVADGAEDTASRVDGIGSPYVIRSWNKKT